MPRRAPPPAAARIARRAWHGRCFTGMATSMPGGKGRIRSLNRTGVAAGKAVAAERSGTRLREPAACERCGAVFARRVWRRDVPVTSALLAAARWTVCPACEQTRRLQYFGRILVHGLLGGAEEDLARRRIRNVATRAGATQPQRRVVSIERDGEALEILTTSQKLAHRIVRELAKVLGGKPHYAWSDDRTLFATLTVGQRARPRRGATAS